MIISQVSYRTNGPLVNCASHAPGSNLAMPRGSIVSMTFIGRFSINLNLMSLQCDNLSGELQDQWSSSADGTIS